MALLGPSGLPLKSSRPASLNGTSEWFIQSLGADRWSSSVDDATYGVLRSFEDIYRSQPVVMAAVNKLARRAATLPLEAFKRVDRDKREPLPSSDSLASLIRRPWPKASTVNFITHAMQGLLLHGNSVFVKVRTGGAGSPPDMLWPLAWTKMSAYAADGSPIIGWSTTQFGGVERWLDVGDVVHFAWMAPDGSEIGVSPLEGLGVTIRTEDAIQRFQVAQFRNGSRPSMMVSIDHDRPTPEMLEYARQRVEAMHKGVDNAGRTFFTGANTKLTPVSLTPVEAALIDQRKLDWNEIGMVYDLSGPLMNDLENATLANVAEYQKALYRDVIPPWTTLLVETLQAQLIDMEAAWIDCVTRFDFTDKLRGDPQELSTAMRSDVEGGLRTRNEARRIMGEPPVGDSNDPQNPANMLTANVNNQGPLDQAVSGAIGTPPAPPAGPPAADQAA